MDSTTLDLYHVTNKIIELLLKVGKKESLLPFRQCLNIPEFEKETFKLVERAAVKKWPDTILTNQLLYLWFPGMMTACSGRTCYKDIDLVVQDELNKLGYLYEDDNKSDSE